MKNVPEQAAAACLGLTCRTNSSTAWQGVKLMYAWPSSHPLAVRSSTRSLSYTFDAPSPDSRTCYLEILGVSAEPALKFLEQYYRWPKLHRDHSRVMNLGSWASN